MLLLISVVNSCISILPLLTKIFFLVNIFILFGKKLGVIKIYNSNNVVYFVDIALHDTVHSYRKALGLYLNSAEEFSLIELNIIEQIFIASKISTFKYISKFFSVILISIALVILIISFFGEINN
ncbi:MAG: hypothetical protein EOM44_13855 [Bacteroidia bacterium]|nr:hypothetical protein [Bacteroidia bacterium]